MMYLILFSILIILILKPLYVLNYVVKIYLYFKSYKNTVCYHDTIINSESIIHRFKLFNNGKKYIISMISKDKNQDHSEERHCKILQSSPHWLNISKHKREIIKHKSSILSNLNKIRYASTQEHDLTNVLKEFVYYFDKKQQNYMMDIFVEYVRNHVNIDDSDVLEICDSDLNEKEYAMFEIKNITFDKLF